MLKIIVNGKTIDAPASYATYEEIVELAGHAGNPTVTYSAWLSKDVRKSGVMFTTCEPVEIVDGMHFEVVHTGNA